MVFCEKSRGVPELGSTAEEANPEPIDSGFARLQTDERPTSLVGSEIKFLLRIVRTECSLRSDIALGVGVRAVYHLTSRLTKLGAFKIAVDGKWYRAKSASRG